MTKRHLLAAVTVLVVAPQFVFAHAANLYRAAPAALLQPAQPDLIQESKSSPKQISPSTALALNMEPNNVLSAPFALTSPAALNSLLFPATPRQDPLSLEAQLISSQAAPQPDTMRYLTLRTAADFSTGLNLTESPINFVGSSTSTEFGTELPEPTSVGLLVLGAGALTTYLRKSPSRR